MEMTVQIRERPELHVAYVRHVEPYNTIGKAFDRLMAWAGPRRHLRFPETRGLAVYPNDPDPADQSEPRSDACITVPPRHIGRDWSGDDGDPRRVVGSCSRGDRARPVRRGVERAHAVVVHERVPAGRPDVPRGVPERPRDPS